MGAIPILVVAVLQGWALYGLHYAIEHKIWPYPELSWLLGLYAVALFVPTALQLLANRLRDRLVWVFVGAIAVVAGGLGGYVGWTLGSIADFSSGFLPLFSLYGALFLAWIIALPFMQARLRRGSWSVAYPDLFEFAWQNALMLFEAKVFTLVFWLLLLLWQALFKVIGISFFSELFSKPAFIYPVSAIAFGYAIYLIESNERIVIALRRHLLGVFGWLLPLVALIAALFLLALPVTGLESLWKTGHATSLMLWLQLLFIHFLNSAYQDGQAEPRYPAWLKTTLRLAVFALPVYAVLSAYSLGLRVEQHGWTAARVWAAIGAFLAAAYSFPYAVAALRRSPWMGSVARINVVLAAIVAATLLLAISPVLDPKRLTASSQVAQLRSGRAAADKFDYNYLRFDLGRYGVGALRELSRDSNADIARLASEALARTARYSAATSAPAALADIASRIELLPAGAALDPGFVAYLQADLAVNRTSHPFCLTATTPKRCLMLAIDLNGDGQAEILTFGAFPQVVYGKVDGKWRKVGTLTASRMDKRGFEVSVRKGDVKPEPHRWSDIAVGDGLYVMSPGQ